MMAVGAPVVVRLAGSYVEAGLPLLRAYDFGEAARIAAEAGRDGNQESNNTFR